MDKKRLLYVVEAMGGGVFTYIVDLANELATKYDIYIAYSVRPQTPINYAEYFTPAIHLIRVKYFTKRINPIKDVLALYEIRRIAHRINPDIIHLHSSKAGVIGRLAFNGNKVSLFYTPHGYSFLMENCSSLKRSVYKSIEGIMAKQKCITISCSLGEYQETQQLTSRALIIENGINTDRLDNIIKNTDRTDHPFTVFTLGRICDQKNPKLFNRIAASMPQTRFLWVGDGELRGELTSNNIEITGWIDRIEAIKCCINADAFLLTSQWEGLPISLLEAMYLKKRCVVSDVIGNHDVIHNGANGYVCKTLEDYVKALSDETNDNMLDNAFDDILNTYCVSKMSQSYSRVYEKYGKR